jgi:zinc protease
MLAEGTAHRDWQKIAEQAEGLGMSLSAFGGLETIGVAIEALAKDWERSVEWAAELVLESKFPLDRFEWTVQQTSAELCSMADQPEVKTGWEFLHQLYHPHPRSRPVQGTLEGLVSLTRDDCLRFWRQSLESGPIVTLSGGLEDEDRVRTRVDSIFGSEARGRVHQQVAPPIGCDEAVRTVSIPGADQAHFYAGHLTVPRADPDLAALQIASIILGSGSVLSGRFPRRLREVEGLAYATNASAAAGAGLDPGRFVVYLGVAPENLRLAERCLREEIDRLVEDGVTKSEVDDAKSYLVGRDPFRRETARQWSELLAESELYGEPVESSEWCTNRWLEVDREAVDAALRRHLRPQEIKVTIGLPA